jgi:hypothetical protein
MSNINENNNEKSCSIIEILIYIILVFVIIYIIRIFFNSNNDKKDYFVSMPNNLNTIADMELQNKMKNALMLAEQEQQNKLNTIYEQNKENKTYAQEQAEIENNRIKNLFLYSEEQTINKQLEMQRQLEEKNRIEIENIYEEIKKNDDIKKMNKLNEQQILTDKSKDKNTLTENKIPVSVINPLVNTLSILDEKVKNGGRLLNLKSFDDIKNLLIDGQFRLRVNLPFMPPYIKGTDFNLNTGKNPNYFYLCVESLMPNCSINGINNECVNVYINDKSKCNIKNVTANAITNPYRLVLVSADYVLDPESKIGINSNFTLKLTGSDKMYLKNIQTEYMPSLYVNDKTYQLYGEILNNEISNIGTLYTDMFNTLCNQDPVQNPTTKTINMQKPGCDYNPDKTVYFTTSKKMEESTPINFHINDDGTVNIQLLRYNSYGQPNESHTISACNFNVNTFAGIEKIMSPGPLGFVFVNLACINPTSDNSSNNLSFTIEITKFPDQFIKQSSIYNLN